MHTSKALKSSHFVYWLVDPDASTSVDFNTFCPDYHELDRVGVVSPRLEDGILQTGYALLALTTAFYDVQRSRSSDFFIYPQHFAFIAADSKGIPTGVGHLDLALDQTGTGAAWSQLDVWPASNWITAPGTPAAMLQKVFDFQINRLFWPEDFKPAYVAGLLPDYARKLLKARLKSVYYYNTSTPTIEIRAAQPAADIIQQSIERLPKAVQQNLGQSHHNGLPNHPYHESYRQVSIDDFLEDISACFE